MSQPNLFDEESFHKYMEELPDLLTGEGTGPDGVFPDGRFYDYDDALQATIETAPDGVGTSSSSRRGTSFELKN